MMDKDKEEIKIAKAWIQALWCLCPYCGKEQETSEFSGDEEICEFCYKCFIVGEIK